MHELIKFARRHWLGLTISSVIALSLTFTITRGMNDLAQVTLVGLVVGSIVGTIAAFYLLSLE